MKATITQAEWQQVAELVLDGQQLLAAVDKIEERIARLLGTDPGEDRDAITDTVSGTMTVDRLLLTLNIGIEGEST